MKRIKLVWCLGIVIGAFAIWFLTNFALRDYLDAKKLIKSIRNQDLSAIEEIIHKNPKCINTYPSITTRGCHSAMNARVNYPLNEACVTGNIDIIELLIENGADVNCNDGRTPLSITYTSKVDNWYNISLILIENGASLDYTTEYTSGQSSILQDIVTSRPGANAPDYIADNSDEVIKAFTFALENCNHSNVEWMRVLQDCVIYDRIEIVKILLDQGYCDVNDTSVGMTALMFAARDSTLEMVQLLLDYGADKSHVSYKGKTAYDYAVEFQKEDMIAILQN